MRLGPSRRGQARVPSRPPSAHEPPEDIGPYLFALCRQLDHSILQPRGITCLIDLASGRLPAVRCQALGLLIAALVIDVAARARVRPVDATITISLRCRPTVWHCDIIDHGVFAVRAEPPACPDIVHRLAQQLKATVTRTVGLDGATSHITLAPSD